MRRLRWTTLATLLAGALVISGCTTDEGAGPDATPSPTETTDTTEPTEATEGTASPDDRTDPTPADETASDGDVSEMAFTSCRSDRVTVPYPEDWHTNDPGLVERCRVFHPEPIDLPDQPQDRDLHWAVSIDIDDASWQDVQPDTGPDEVLESREITLNGRRTLVVEQRSAGQALLPEGERRYGYLVDLDGEVLLATTHSVGDTDYERDKAVLDRMMEDLRITDPDREGDDPEEVVSHSTGQRDFSVHARSIANGVCLEVRTAQGSGEDCGPVDGPLDVRIITVGDDEYVTGIVGGGGGPIVDVEMLANDGSAIDDEFATAELVEILGESGFRAFAPAQGPDTYSAVVGHGPDGEEVARVEL